MSLNFNVSPYYDDFDQSKNFHRILFKPGYAVQARELTQSQSILQDQITKFADNIFRQNSPVTGGQLTNNLKCYYVKVENNYDNSAIDITKFDGKLIQNSTGEILARVLSTSQESNGDPNTLIVSYLSGNHFNDGDLIVDTNSNLACLAIASGSTGYSSVVSISQGVFYVLGNFVQVPPKTIILDKYGNSPSVRVGLTITETIQDYIDDASLLDPAIGASNYQAPGADRYYIGLSLDTRPLQFGDDQDFIELAKIVNGSIEKMVDGSVYGVIDDYFAKRTFDTNGDYIVNDFKLTPKTTDITIDPNRNTYTMSIGKGMAYVHGYRLENTSTVDLVSNRSKTILTHNNHSVITDFGSYFLVSDLKGTTTRQSGISNTFFDLTSTQKIDFHCVSLSNINATTETQYNSTLIGTGFIRGLTYDHNTNDNDSTTYVYKAFVYDINNTALSGNTQSATQTTIRLDSTASNVNDAYVGVMIYITDGTNAGDFRTITSYNGSTKTATVDKNWTINPDTSSKYSLNYSIKDIETIVSTDGSFPAVLESSAKIDNSCKYNNVESGYTELKNPNVSEMLFRVGNPYISSMSDSSYQSQQVWRNVQFQSTSGAVTASLNFTVGGLDSALSHYGTPGSTLSTDLVKRNFTIVVTDKGNNSTINVGDVLAWSNTSIRTVTLDDTSSIATLSSRDLNPFTATIVENIDVYSADSSSSALITKVKNLIKANTSTINILGTNVDTFTWVDDSALTSTGQIYIEQNGLVSPGQKQSLYLSDVKRIVKIIDTKDPSLPPVTGMLTNAFYDVTNNYNFDNGQRDSYYDHSSISLKPGLPQPLGNLLVFVDYYQHAGGDGFFSIHSYLNSSLPEQYQEIASYVSRSGTTYNLRDTLDFRPARKNLENTFIFRFGNEFDTQRHGSYLPIDASIFKTDYSFYLGRKDKLVLSKDRSFQIIEGAPSIRPLFPTEPDGSLVIAQITHNPYTGFIPTESPNGSVSDLSIEKVKHKRFTMQDIAGLENRINNVEYYTSLNLLEQKAQNLQIPDAYGLNRFKNGILVDDFSSFSTSDTYNADFNSCINRRDRTMTATHNIKNFPLKSSDQVYSLSKLSENIKNTLNYSTTEDGSTRYYTLPYENSVITAQKLASRTVNVNPFSYTIAEGIISLSPNVDNWVDTNYSPALLITDPNLQVFQSNPSKINVLSAGDWQAISSTSYSTSKNVVGHGINSSPFGYVGYTATQTITSTNLSSTDILGPYDKIGNTYSLNNGYITDISVLPYIRPQQVVVRARGMLINSSINALFDKSNVKNYIRKSNVIELVSTNQNTNSILELVNFKEDDVIGYISNNKFIPTARVLGVYIYTDTLGTKKVRLYVAADQTSSIYAAGTLCNAFFDASGNYVSSTAKGTILNTSHFGGEVRNANPSNNSFGLSPLCSAADGYYVGQSVYFVNGTSQGSSATIINYTNNVATLDKFVNFTNGDLYSIGQLSTDESGSFYGVFNIPENTFHTGQRIFRLDNSVNGNINSETTYAESSFYAEGLHTQSQSIDFGASPAGAKNTFSQTNQKTTVNVATYYSPWDPVAQTFIISKENYPNGLFLNDLKLFFSSKPTHDNSTITLSIVGTLNGYPNGTTLDHSIVTLTPDQVNVSSVPHNLDTTTSTTFTFNSPVYIQSGVLYAFIVKSNSNQYKLWTASNGDTALASSVKNLPTDPVPTSITKIGSAPYVGSLFLSQNSQTWTADQNQSLMFVMDRCKFSTTTTQIMYVVPNKLPQRTLIDQSIQYYLDANNISTATNLISYENIDVDAFNITTTDFIPTSTNINYSYNATTKTGAAAGIQTIVPGKYGTTTSDNIFLNDGKGERVLIANSNSSFVLYTQLSSLDDSVSPVISDAGLSVYSVEWNINNCELSNNNIIITDNGSGYDANTISVTISGPTDVNGTPAVVVPEVINGELKSITLTYPGSGYIETPVITITGDCVTQATAIVSGETSSSGGPAVCKYVTKKVVLDSGSESGDLNVYLTAYRPPHSDILVYYKVLNIGDTQKFEDNKWQLMTKINSCDTLFSRTRDDLNEYTFAPGKNGVDQGYISYTNNNGQTFTSFSQFAIKVVFTTLDKTSVPFATDIRAIALTPNI